MIVVTGALGFIGYNLVKKLNLKKINTTQSKILNTQNL